MTEGMKYSPARIRMAPSTRKNPLNSDKMALEIKENVQGKISYPVMIAREGSINRVLVGPLTEATAKSTLTTLRQKGYTDSFIKRF